MKQLVYLLIIISGFYSCNCLKKRAIQDKGMDEIFSFKLRKEGLNILTDQLGEKFTQKQPINFTLIYIINPNDTLLKMKLYKAIPNCKIERVVFDSFVSLFNKNEKVKLLFEHIITERKTLIRNRVTTYTSFVIDIYNRKGKKLYVYNW